MGCEPRIKKYCPLNSTLLFKKCIVSFCFSLKILTIFLMSALYYTRNILKIMICCYGRGRNNVRSSDMTEHICPLIGHKSTNLLRSVS